MGALKEQASGLTDQLKDVAEGIDKDALQSQLQQATSGLQDQAKGIFDSFGSGGQ